MSEIRDINDVIEEILHDKTEPLVYVEGESVFIDKEVEYDIDLPSIKGKADLLELVHHISKKKWVTKEHITAFIQVVCNAKGWKIYGTE